MGRPKRTNAGGLEYHVLGRPNAPLPIFEDVGDPDTFPPSKCPQSGYHLKMIDEERQGEELLIRKTILSLAPVELVGSAVNAAPMAMLFLLTEAYGVLLSWWLYAILSAVFALLRGIGLSELNRSQVNDIPIDGTRIHTPLRGILNGLVVAASATVAYLVLFWGKRCQEPLF